MFGVQRCLDRDRRDLLWGIVYVRRCLLYLISQKYRLQATLDDLPGSMWASCVVSFGGGAGTQHITTRICIQSANIMGSRGVFTHVHKNISALSPCPCTHWRSQMPTNHPEHLRRRSLAALRESALSKRKWMYSGSTRVKHHGVVSYPRSSSQRPTAWLHSTRDA